MLFTMAPFSRPKRTEQRTNFSLPLELLFTFGGEEIFRKVPCFPLPANSGVRKFGPSFDFFDHAIY